MKDGKFETQAEIWEHLLKGGKVKYIDEEIIGLVDGQVHLFFSDGSFSPTNWGFYEPWRFSIYEEPKPKKKVTLYRYTLKSINSESIYQTAWDSIELKENKFTTILKTESKEIEVDDV